MGDSSLGEFEQTILLAILGSGDSAFALEVRRKIEEETGRRVSRGAFYTTLERLERKGLVIWTKVQPATARRREAHRLFSVTPAGLEMLRSTQEHLKARWARLAEVLEKS